MKMIDDTHKVQALNIFMDEVNIGEMNREDIITGVKSILKQKTVYPESKELAEIAIRNINENRGRK